MRELSPIERLQAGLRKGLSSPLDVALDVISHRGPGTYAYQDDPALLRRAAELAHLYPNFAAWPLLYGVPVSLKDCFDLCGSVTSCGSRFYAERNPVAEQDSWVAEQLLRAGAMITGKTHLHQLAYGITGENADFGDCLQPRDKTLLTGGSSSGAAASVQEGSAVAAVGTDTGGSIRVPAALCGLAGYRASLGLIAEEACWRGGAHLAMSFDTIGVLFRDLRDGPVLAEALFGVQVKSGTGAVRIGFVGDEFLEDCEPAVLDAFADRKLDLTRAGASLDQFDAGFWADSMEIFAPIQASEAAALHRGFYEHFEPAIAERLAWGASIGAEELGVLRTRLRLFRVRMSELFERFDFLLTPCAPVSRLVAGEDQSGARKRILRYTTPMSLGGNPVVTLPGEQIGSALGTGMQLVGEVGRDAELLAFAAGLGAASR